ncbi:hypothetical protein GCM10009819_09100 [Agromyces tropicus]|uniref:Uncharacterized protein n=1 Tax=Agromyces tropicus TaxID=555371 RepID=A0ABP5FJ50_9MICO
MALLVGEREQDVEHRLAEREEVLRLAFGVHRPSIRSFGGLYRVTIHPLTSDVKGPDSAPDRPADLTADSGAAPIAARHPLDRLHGHPSRPGRAVAASDDRSPTP